MQDPFPLYHAGRRYPRTRWTSRKSASIVFVLCLLLALLMLGCADTGVSQQVSGQQTIVTPQPTRTSQPLLAVATFVAHRLTGTNQPPPTEVALLSPTETPVIPTNVPTSAPAPTRVPATLALRPQPNLAVAPEPTEPRLAVASPSEAAACPTGVCVTKLVVSAAPKRRQPVTFTASFENSTGSEKTFNVVILLFEADSKKGFGESYKNKLAIPAGTSEATISHVAVTGPGPCIRLYARVAAHHTESEKQEFANTDGPPISTSFDVCP